MMNWQVIRRAYRRCQEACCERTAKLEIPPDLLAQSLTHTQIGHGKTAENQVSGTYAIGLKIT